MGVYLNQFSDPLGFANPSQVVQDLEVPTAGKEQKSENKADSLFVTAPEEELGTRATFRTTEPLAVLAK